MVRWWSYFYTFLPCNQQFAAKFSYRFNSFIFQHFVKCDTLDKNVGCVHEVLQYKVYIFLQNIQYLGSFFLTRSADDPVDLYKARYVTMIMSNILFMKIFSVLEIFQLSSWIDNNVESLTTVVHITQAFGCFNFFIYLAKEYCRFVSDES